MTHQPPHQPRGSRHRAMVTGWQRLLPPSRRDRMIATVASVVLIVAAVVALVVRPTDGQHPSALPPTPPSPSPTISIGRSTQQPPTAKATRKPIACSRHRATGDGPTPDQICVPAIGVDASVMRLGLNSDRTVEVPPLSKVGDAGWYKYSAAPGAVGPTVILGHVDSAQYGEGVFYRLGKLRAGDKVLVTRGDGRVATFAIDRVDEVSKTRFPTQSVYGPTSGPAIRLITCGGRFDASSGNYLDNIIAYGTLQSVRAT